MSQLTLFFEPLDVLQFRDHRPFDAGLHVRAHSVFPRPSVFLGCLRTALFRQLGADFHSSDSHFGITKEWAKAALGTRREAGTLTLRGPLLAKWQGSGLRPNLYLPMPHDLVLLEEESDQERYQVLRPFLPKTLRFVGGQMQQVDGRVPWTGQTINKHTSSGWLTEQGAQVYLNAGPTPMFLTTDHLVRRDSLIQREDRVGIARDGTTLTADEGMFYVSSTFRLAPAHGFAVDVMAGDGDLRGALEKLDGVIVPLGGKGHRARIRLYAGALGLPAAPGAGRRKIWLLAPAALKLESGPLACIATERAVPLGGYDLVERAPKPLRRAVPAGSVLYLSDDSAPDLCQHFGLSSEDHRAGYGTFITGTWE